MENLRRRWLSSQKVNKSNKEARVQVRRLELRYSDVGVGMMDSGFRRVGLEEVSGGFTFTFIFTFTFTFTFIFIFAFGELRSIEGLS